MAPLESSQPFTPSSDSPQHKSEKTAEEMYARNNKKKQKKHNIAGSLLCACKYTSVKTAEMYKTSLPKGSGAQIDINAYISWII